METDADCQLVRGRTYSNIATQDNARAHLGDVHNYGSDSTISHIYYLCSGSSQQPSPSLVLYRHGGVAGSESEPHSLKRGRSPTENEYTQKLNKEESLEYVLNKLGKFSKSIQDQRIGKDAKKIARRIALAVSAAKQQAGLHSLVGSSTHVGHDKSDFRNIRKSLKIAGRVDVNTGFQHTRHDKLTRVIRKCDIVTCEQWEISLRSTTFESRNSDGTEVIESLITLYLEPLFSGSGLPVTVRIGETRTDMGVTFINPVILAYRTVPNNSEVFEMIRNDDLAGLVALLADGKATVRDCDEIGGTLLHYACRYGSPRCCQYLTDKGADIERIARVIDASRLSYDTPLSSCVQNRDHAHCGQILLKSGADPTFCHGYSSPPVVLSMIFSPALLSSILVEGISFLDLKNFRNAGLSLWLMACGREYLSISMLQNLINAGCDVAEKDDKGWNCLFHSVLTSYRPESSYELETLQYLLSKFDDIHAKDAEGRTIFDHVDLIQNHRSGGYKRDLWYCAFERAGIDVSSHLAQHPRVPSYAMSDIWEYTPEHYHALKHLQSWDEDNFRSQMDRLLQEIPLDEDEALEMERLKREKAEMERLEREKAEMKRLKWEKAVSGPNYNKWGAMTSERATMIWRAMTTEADLT